MLSARERLAALYSDRLSGTPEIAVPVAAANERRSWFVYAIRVCGSAPRALRDRLMAGLQERGIASRPYFTAIHRQPYFKQIRLSSNRPLPQTELASDSCLALPFFPSMTEEQLDEVCAAVRKILGEARGAVIPAHEGEAARAAV